MNIKGVAGIQYVGLGGDSKSCQEAVERLVQYRERIQHARILTCKNSHALLLTVDPEDLVAVKSGFTSGYGGSGPTSFSEVLLLLRELDAEIDECDVSGDIIERLDASVLTTKDIETIDRARKVRPSRWPIYIQQDDAKTPQIFKGFRPVIPWAVIDSRITDLALRFFENPDDSILTGFRRLEDIIRDRTGLTESSTKLCSQAFTGDKAKLVWDVADKSEQNGRAQLFSGTFMAYRNPRAHREELKKNIRAALAEFLMLNQLYLLEQAAIENC